MLILQAMFMLLDTESMCVYYEHPYSMYVSTHAYKI